MARASREQPIDQSPLSGIRHLESKIVQCTTRVSHLDRNHGIATSFPGDARHRVPSCSPPDHKKLSNIVPKIRRRCCPIASTKTSRCLSRRVSHTSPSFRRPDCLPQTFPSSYTISLPLGRRYTFRFRWLTYFCCLDYLDSFSEAHWQERAFTTTYWRNTRSQMSF